MVLNRPRWRKYDANSSVLSLRLKLAKLSADQVFTESEFHTVGAATVKAREATEVSISGRWRCAVEDRSILVG